MDEKYITIDNPEYFEKITTEHGIGYINKNYTGPIAIDSTIISNGTIPVVQFHFPKDLIYM
jgi:hypothetical protein